jgi:primosomal protein N' (replication factor Y)
LTDLRAGTNGFISGLQKNTTVVQGNEFAMFVRVAVNIPSLRTFTYAVPDRLQSRIGVGKRVLVPFGRKTLTGFPLETLSAPAIEQTKEILDVLDAEPLFDESDLNFYRWTADYYIYPLGRALTEILPGGINVRSQRWISPAVCGIHGASDDLTGDQRRVMDWLHPFPSGLSEERLKRSLRIANPGRIIRELQKKGLLEVTDRIQPPAVSPKTEKTIALHQERLSGVRLTDRQRRVVDFLLRNPHVPASVVGRTFDHAAAVLGSLEKKGLLDVRMQDAFRHHGGEDPVGIGGIDVTLNRDQQNALQEISRGLTGGSYSPYLLHGVTGSGKTEIYLRAISEVLKAGGGVIGLVPEIALTPQLYSRFVQRFPDQEIALMHSGISPHARYDQWRRIFRGDIRMVIGARSAIFAPVRSLRLIIVDEEHDPSYKQDDRLRYQARDLAIVRAKQRDAAVILGSATPSMQSYLNSRRGKCLYLRLPQRVADRPLPTVEIVDMTTQKDPGGRPLILSSRLMQALSETLQERKQALLFLNRRGFDTFVVCLDCRHFFHCLNCSVAMSHHAAEGKLKCHYCDLTIEIPRRCPACGGFRIHSFGVGTQKLEAEVKKNFPAARVMRMDSDTTAASGAHGRILRALERKEIDILVGTQMIAKGHDFPEVTLVGVICADTSLNMPDFRATEKSFQLLTQVSGRGGRGDVPGKVVIQTFNPDHYAIRRAKNHDDEGFFRDEFPARQSLSWPPFSRMINLQMSSLDQEEGRQAAERIAAYARSRCAETSPADIGIVGPAEAPIAKIKGRYRWQMLLTGKDSKALHVLAREILSNAVQARMDLKVDVDPVNFM